MFGFLSPIALWTCAAALPLVLLYVLKTRRRRVRVSSSAMFEVARREAAARDPWKRLIPELALLLQLLALVALAFAFARPVGRGGALDADAVVFVVDRSASMATRVKPISSDRPESYPTRLVRAKEAALEKLDALGVGAEVAVVVAGRDARVVSALQRGPRAAKDAISSVEAGLVEGDLEPALDVARDLLRGRGGRKLVVLLTDAALATSPTWLDEEGGASLEVVAVDSPVNGARSEGNVGIVRLDVHRSEEGGDRVDVGVVLAAFGAPADGRTRYVTLRRIDRQVALDAQKVDVGPSGRAAATLSFRPAADHTDELATLVVELSPNDALPLDDAAQVVVPPPRTMPVVLSSLGLGGSSWIAKALGADPDVKLTKVSPDVLPRTPVEPWSLIISADTCPTTAPGGGDVVVVNPPPGPCAGRTIGAAVSGAELSPITSWSPTDPRLRYVTFEDVHLGRVVPIAPAGGDARHGAAALGPASLVRAEELAVMADASTLDRTVTIWGFDPADGDLARKASFVLLVRDAVDVARARRDRSWAPTTHGGVAARITATSGATEVLARALVGDQAGQIVARAPVLEGVALLEGLDQPGPYSLEGSATGAPLTVSLMSDLESDTEHVVEIARQKVQPISTDVAKPAEAQNEKTRARNDLRWVLAGAAVLFLALDALWLTRRGKRVVARLTRAV